MTVWDAPNQQVVRADESGPGDEGTGGAAASEPSELDAMTKDELLAMAQELGVSPANAAMSKAELRAGIEEKQAGG